MSFSKLLRNSLLEKASLFTVLAVVVFGSHLFSVRLVLVVWLDKDDDDDDEDEEEFNALDFVIVLPMTGLFLPDPVAEVTFDLEDDEDDG